MKTLIEVLKSHFEYRSQLIKLARADITKTYKGAALGWSWAIISPAVTIFVFWFAFSIGLRTGRPVEGYPFFLWLIAGMVPWFYMRDSITSGATSMRRYSYLVTKIKFPICTIPTFINISLFIVHLGLMGIVILIFIGFGFMPDIYYLQMPFYMLLAFMFFSSWGLFAGVLGALSRDFTNLVRAITTALFWLSGILYDATAIPSTTIRNLMLFNPITIIANGFRNCFITKEWFWESPQQLINFAIVYAIMILLSVWAFKKLRKDIPDVL